MEHRYLPCCCDQLPEHCWWCGLSKVEHPKQGEMSRPNYHCPMCHSLSELVINPEQAFCTNDGCNVVMFNPSLPDGGMSNVHEIQWVKYEPEP